MSPHRAYRLFSTVLGELKQNVRSLKTHSSTYLSDYRCSIKVEQMRESRFLLVGKNSLCSTILRNEVNSSYKINQSAL